MALEMLNNNFAGKQWVGYDDVAMLEHKSRFIKDNGYGGYGLTWKIENLHLTYQEGRVDAISRPVWC